MEHYCIVYQGPRLRHIPINFARTSTSCNFHAFTLITNSTPSAILASCRLVNQEAKSILNASWQHYFDCDIPDGPAPRIEADILALVFLSRKKGLLNAMAMRYEKIVAQKRKQTLRSRLDHVVNSIISLMAEEGYRPRDNATTDEVQTNKRLINMAAYSICHEKHRMDQNPIMDSNPLTNGLEADELSPQIHVGLRIRPEDEDVECFRGLVKLNWNYMGNEANNCVCSVLHVLSDDATDEDNQKIKFLHIEIIRSGPGALSRIRCQFGFNEDNSEVYETSWKEGERR